MLRIDTDALRRDKSISLGAGDIVFDRDPVRYGFLRKKQFGRVKRWLSKENCYYKASRISRIDITTM